MTQRFTAFTLVDITETGVQRVSESNTKEYHQQQNLNVLLQTIGLRTQIFEPKVLIHHNIDLSKEKFGDFFINEEATVWSVNFQIETDSVWTIDQDELGILKEDANGIAITPDLDNTVEFPVNIFDTQDNINLYFM